MQIREHSGGAAALLLLAVAVLLAVPGSLPRNASPYASSPAPLPLAGSTERAKLDWCLDNVGMIHDVHWAAACAKLAEETQVDDPIDCTLPDDRARPLNAARASEEQQCLAEASPGPR